MAIKMATFGQFFNYQGQECRIQPRCNRTWAKGKWICSSHDLTFESSEELLWHFKDVDSDHFVVWECEKHGPEVP